MPGFSIQPGKKMDPSASLKNKRVALATILKLFHPTNLSVLLEIIIDHTWEKILCNTNYLVQSHSMQSATEDLWRLALSNENPLCLKMLPNFPAGLSSWYRNNRIDFWNFAFSCLFTSQLALAIYYFWD